MPKVHIIANNFSSETYDSILCYKGPKWVIIVEMGKNDGGRLLLNIGFRYFWTNLSTPVELTKMFLFRPTRNQLKDDLVVLLHSISHNIRSGNSTVIRSVVVVLAFYLSHFNVDKS